MHPRIVLAIARKDLRDAVRDGRVLLGLLMPLGLGLLYNVVMPDQQRQSVAVAIATSDATTFPQALRSVTRSAIDLRITNVGTAGEVRALVRDKTVVAGLVVPAGFDEALAAGRTPPLTLVRPGGAQSFGADYLASSLDGALRLMAGQRSPAVVTTEISGGSAGGFAAVVAAVGIRKYMVLGTLIMLVAMIAIYVLPVLLTEEAEKKTLNALTMVGSHSDVVAAKALVGLAYIAIAVPLLLLVTGLAPASPVLFAAGVIALSVTLIGFGLLLGALVRNMNQLNTWSSVPLLVLIVPVFFLALDVPAWAQWLMAASPGSQALRLLADGLSGKAVFGDSWLAFAIIAAWAAAGYGLLLRTLARRES